MPIELIAEWGIPCDLSHALRQMQASRDCGARWAKWQMLTPERLAGREAVAYWSDALPGGHAQLEVFGPGIPDADWRRVLDACRAGGVGTMVTPFDLEAVDRLERLGVEAYKIASGDITYRALIRKIATTGKPVFLSTGAANGFEIRRAIGWLKGCHVTVMACDLVYPCPPADSALVTKIELLKQIAPDRPLGYSDHTRGTLTGAVAVALGVTVLEKHLTLDPDGDRPDDGMALTEVTAERYLGLAREAAVLLATPAGTPEAAAKVGARRSAHAARDLDADTILEPGDITWLRPAPPGALGPDAKIVGRRLAVAVAAGDRIKSDDLL